MNGSAAPELLTPRLRLRLFRAADAPVVQRLAGERAVADTTLNIPHPYPDGAAEAWIATHRLFFARREQAVFALTLRESGELLGACGLTVDDDGRAAELGYWLGRPHWGRGYASEGAAAVLAFAFNEFGLERVYAHCMVRNPASARVLARLGLVREAYLPGMVEKWGAAEDVERFGLARAAWSESRVRR